MPRLPDGRVPLGELVQAGAEHRLPDVRSVLRDLVPHFLDRATAAAHATG